MLNPTTSWESCFYVCVGLKLPETLHSMHLKMLNVR